MNKSLQSKPIYALNVGLLIPITLVIVLTLGGYLVVQYATSDPRLNELRFSYGIYPTRSCTAPCTTAVTRQVWGNPITLGEFVDKVGNPDRVVAFINGTGENADFVVEVFYITKGLAVYGTRSLRPPLDFESRVTREMVVGAIEIWQSRTFDKMILEMRSVNGTATFLEQSEPWSGFAEIKLSTPGYWQIQ